MKSILNQIQWKISFKGRINRAPFWWTALAMLIVQFIGVIICAIVPPLGVVLEIYLVIWVICLVARRFHDIGQSGWWTICPIYNLIVAFMASQPGENQWGSNPLGVSSQMHKEPVKTALDSYEQTKSIPEHHAATSPSPVISARQHESFPFKRFGR